MARLGYITVTFPREINSNRTEQSWFIDDDLEGHSVELLFIDMCETNGLDPKSYWLRKGGAGVDLNLDPHEVFVDGDACEVVAI